ncbi:MAG: ABC transporter substrate-binding protein [Candidatus Parcubacteria bacterium]|nr:ABC transporter substrate-binding protein [Candidatus Parcubacteria bacterium]
MDKSESPDSDSKSGNTEKNLIGFSDIRKKAGKYFGMVFKNRLSFWQIIRFPLSLNKKERIIFTALSILFIGSFAYLSQSFYFRNTEIKPALGGKYTEGLVGQPRFINPIYSSSFDADRDIVEPIFSGIMKYDSSGKIVNDLAEKIDLDSEGKIYEIYLKNDILWHDGEKFSADDIIFTIKTIQDADYRSPLRANWIGIEVEKIENENGVRFKLEKPYAAFLERLTLKIIPKHIWADIPAQNFPLSVYNLKPIGTGPYKFKSLEYSNDGISVSSIDLTAFPGYFGKTPNLMKVSFKFFKNEDELIQSVNKNEIDGFSLEASKILKFSNDDKFKEYLLLWPRYFAVFLNPKKSKFLSDNLIRQALNYATNKEEIINEIIGGKGYIVESPILPEFFGFNPPSSAYQFDLVQAESLIKQAGFEKKDGQLVKYQTQTTYSFKTELKTGSQGKAVEGLQACLSMDKDIYPGGKITGYFGNDTNEAVKNFQEKYADDILKPSNLKEGNGIVGPATRIKLNEICNKAIEPEYLTIILTTVEDPLMEETAKLIKKQWDLIGIKTEINTVSVSDLEKDYIKTRNYEALLFGEVLGTIPDLFPFWHSSQIKDPGLNLANYESKSADNLLEATRISLDHDKIAANYESFQNIIINDAPVIFLYSPDYIYFVSLKINGVEEKNIAEPSKRLLGIENWFIKTKRVWK